MSKPIQPHQIETARTAFRNGKSIPEACALAHMSRASFNKYLGNEIKVWMEEHEIAKAKAEILPEPANFNVVMTDELIEDDKSRTVQDIDDNKIMIETQMEQDRLAAEELMTDEQFISLLQYEFEQVTNYDQARELYWEYKPQSIINITRVEAFRAIYEQTLNRVTGRPTVKVTQSKPKAEPKTIENTKDNYGSFRLEWAEEVNQLNSKFDCGIKKINKKRHINWTQSRYLEHIYYWLRLKSNDKSQWIGISRFRKLESDEARRKLVNELVEELENS